MGIISGLIQKPISSVIQSIYASDDSGISALSVPFVNGVRPDWGAGRLAVSTDIYTYNAQKTAFDYLGNVYKLPKHALIPDGVSVFQNQFAVDGVDWTDASGWALSGGAISQTSSTELTITSISSGFGSRVTTPTLLSGVNVSGRTFSAVVRVKADIADNVGKSVLLNLTRVSGGAATSVSQSVVLTDEYQDVVVGPATFVTNNVGVLLRVYGDTGATATSGCIIQYPAIIEWRTGQDTSKPPLPEDIKCFVPVGPELLVAQAAANWVAGGTNTVVDDGDDGVLITYVDTASGARIDFDSASGAFASDAVVGAGYVISGEAKVNTGSSVDIATQNPASTLATVTSTAFVDFFGYAVAESATSFRLFQANMDSGETINIRNLSVRQSASGLYCSEYTPNNSVSSGVITAGTGDLLHPWHWERIGYSVPVKRLDVYDPWVADTATVEGTRKIPTTRNGYYYTGRKVADLPGSSGDYISTPDSVAASVTGDITLIAYVNPTDWQDGANRTLVAKYKTAGNQRSYRLVKDSANKIAANISQDGTYSAADLVTATSANTYTGGVWLRATFDVVSGTGRLYECFNSPAVLPGADDWVEIPANDNAITATSIFDSAEPVEVGSINTGSGDSISGTVHRALVIASTDPTATPVVDCNAGDYATGSTFTSGTTGEVWTLNGNVTIGSTDSSEPTWPTTIDNAVADKGVWWTCSGYYKNEGVSIEPEATQDMATAAVLATGGSSSTLPTSWAESDSGGIQSVVGYGVSPAYSGAKYVDVRINNTTGGNQGSLVVVDSTSITGVSQGDDVTISAYLEIISGTVAGNIQLGALERNSGNSLLVSTEENINVSGEMSRRHATITLANASVDRYRPFIGFDTIPNGTDFTIRITLPNSVQEDHVSSVILGQETRTSQVGALKYSIDNWLDANCQVRCDFSLGVAQASITAGTNVWSADASSATRGLYLQNDGDMAVYDGTSFATITDWAESAGQVVRTAINVSTAADALKLAAYSPNVDTAASAAYDDSLGTPDALTVGATVLSYPTRIHNLASVPNGYEASVTLSSDSERYT